MNISRSDGYYKPDLPPWVFGISATYLFFLGIFSFISLVFIFWLYYRVKALRTDFNLLLMNLLFGELVMSVFGIPVDFLASARYGWDMGAGMCRATGFILTLFGIAAINNLTSISLFRFFILMDKKGNFKHHSRKFAIFLIISSWTLSFLVAIPPLFGWGRFVIEENGMSCAPSWKHPQDFSYNLFLFIVGFFCPLAVISVTGICILVSVKKQLAQICDVGTKTHAAKEKKMTEMLIIMVSVFVFCWGPYAVQSLMGVLGFSDKISLLFSVLPLQFAKTSILWNPIIFVLMNQTFQKAFLMHIPQGTKDFFVKRFRLEEGSITDTEVGRRHHPKLFGKYRHSFWAKFTTKNGDTTKSYAEDTITDPWCEEGTERKEENTEKNLVKIGNDKKESKEDQPKHVEDDKNTVEDSQNAEK